MSYFDDASLVMIPSGYKASKVYSVKPTDGTGDLTFTRSNDTASRVASNGLIEKVRTNLALYSEDFSNAAWVKNQVILTADTISNDTTNNFHRFYQITTSFSGTGEISFSVELKYNDHQYLSYGLTDATAYRSQVVVDLVGHTITQQYTQGGTSFVSSSFVSVGDGWYKLSATINATSSWDTNLSALGFLLNGSSFSTASYLGTGTGAYIRNAQVEFGVSTDYIATTSAAVSVGPVANVPRLDYLGSSCPRLLLEPQRTNSLTYSEQFDNAAWTKDGSTATANAAVSPDGYTNADKLFETAVTDFHRVYGPTISVTSGTTYTASVFVKAAEVTTFAMEMRLTSNVADATFDLVAGTTSGSGIIQDYGNGWYRCIVTGTATATGGGRPMFFIKQRSSYAGNASNGLLIYGAQFETGAYATSYIPTLGAAVTRGADSASKTGISSLTSASEYTIFWEGTHIPTGEYNSFATFYNNANNSFSARFYRNNTDNEIRASLLNSATGLSLDMGSGVTTQNAKCAMRAKAGSYAFYVNGALVNSNTSALAPSSNLDTVNLQYFTSGQSFDQKTGQLLFFKTALSNADLAALTA
jgi:hypothetical protein